MKKYHVIKRSNKYAVVKSRNKRATSLHNFSEQAYYAAKQMAEIVVVHNDDGSVKFVDKNQQNER